MIKDKKGVELKVGDIVTIKCVIKEIREHEQQSLVVETRVPENSKEITEKFTVNHNHVSQWGNVHDLKSDWVS